MTPSDDERIDTERSTTDVADTLRDRSALRTIRFGMIALSVLFPSLSFVLRGSYWLWLNGYLLIWSIAATAVAVVIYLFERPVTHIVRLYTCYHSYLNECM